MLFIGGSEQLCAQEGTCLQIEGLLNRFTSYALHLLVCPGWRQASQVNDCKLNFFRTGMDDLNKLPVLDVVTGAPYFMTLKDRSETPLQDQDIQRFLHS